MSFRKLQLNDYSKYLDMINEFRPTTFSEDLFKETLNKINTSSEIWIYEKDNMFLATGTIIYEYKYLFNVCKYAHIEDVCIRTSYRRKGLGKLLMKHLINQARDCYKITLVCADENKAFYESCGLENRGNQMCQLLKNL